MAVVDLTTATLIPRDDVPLQLSLVVMAGIVGKGLNKTESIATPAHHARTTD
ncbi:hypothetical protein FHS27_005971 [Rhodopirellula rubra]|uniref:Uncharacterized protein n=1 Tax=Aporhodopirellula rubra TaxID=980271 RepID=A0A7W5E4M2_9BACT|nr:hypothetical protein [Aporhodopirellula rubra]